MHYTLIGGIAIAALIVIGGFASYNRFVSQRNLIDESWHGIDVELTRRHDLIPNLVKTVQAYATHEREIFEHLGRAREAAWNHRLDSPNVRAAHEDSLTQAVARVTARAEDYPQLRASENFLALQEELTNTEDRLAAARRFYNGNVRAYNIRVRSIPSNLIARVGGFDVAEFFELSDPAIAAAPSTEL